MGSYNPDITFHMWLIYYVIIWWFYLEKRYRFKSHHSTLNGSLETHHNHLIHNESFIIFPYLSSSTHVDSLTWFFLPPPEERCLVWLICGNINFFWILRNAKYFFPKQLIRFRYSPNFLMCLVLWLKYCQSRVKHK